MRRLRFVLLLPTSLQKNCGHGPAMYIYYCPHIAPSNKFLAKVLVWMYLYKYIEKAPIISSPAVEGDNLQYKTGTSIV